ncbi:hypothetical protein EJ04DRAFT_509207 [Polyplosphaeria fusca]|uniref:F-box domain-containing protein n=1 Tax=Polyplosphaeria fusca TaxID=682080 RepID=A0A9P4R9B3_9PLEO|nr:hypothetical protein EJ04DRAFT_509207 [Polyplosphaeria fusca]
MWKLMVCFRGQAAAGNPVSACMNTHPKGAAYGSANRVGTNSPMSTQRAPIFKLPVELLQEIAALLEPSSAAAFCLSSSGICFAVGLRHLRTYLSSGRHTFETRKNIEVLERAFPSHWYCFFCDKFHRHEKGCGPKDFRNETNRPCVESNCYLHDGWDYILAHHHVRLALNRHLWGLDYGIPLESFTYQRIWTFKAFRTELFAKLNVEARIVSGHLLLYAVYTVTGSRRAFIRRQLPDMGALQIPQIVYGHRDSVDGHTGLASEVRRALSGSERVSWSTELCSTCATDYRVTARGLDNDDSEPGRVATELKFEAWRDLGNGRNPFDSSWRAHGEIGNGLHRTGGDVIRLTGLYSGDIRRSFVQGVRLPYAMRPGSRDFYPTSLCELGGDLDWEFRWPASVTHALTVLSRSV